MIIWNTKKGIISFYTGNMNSILINYKYIHSNEINNSTHVRWHAHIANVFTFFSKIRHLLRMHEFGCNNRRLMLLHYLWESHVRISLRVIVHTTPIIRLLSVINWYKLGHNSLLYFTVGHYHFCFKPVNINCNAYFYWIQIIT